MFKTFKCNKLGKLFSTTDVHHLKGLELNGRSDRNRVLLTKMQELVITTLVVVINEFLGKIILKFNLKYKNLCLKVEDIGI